MRGVLIRVAIVAALSLGVAAPAFAAKGSAPAASIAKPGGCETIEYVWSGFRKAYSATIELYHNGIFQARESTQPVGADGSYPLPASLAGQIVEGEHYTIFGRLKDASGRSIAPSGAVWWGVC